MRGDTTEVVLAVGVSCDRHVHSLASRLDAVGPPVVAPISAYDFLLQEADDLWQLTRPSGFVKACAHLEQ